MGGGSKTAMLMAGMLAATMAWGKGMDDLPAWNAKSSEATYAWFLENEYGVRPAAAEKPSVTFAPAEPDKVMMGGAARRKRVRVTYTGPYGTGSFVFTAFIPTAARKPASAFILICNRSPEKNIDPERNVTCDFWPAEEIVRRGYAAIAFWNGDLAPDEKAARNTKGVFAIYEPQGVTRAVNAWGTLSAWAWGASRVMDWVETEPTLDARHVGVVGHSRGGKAALLAGITDRRFAMACSNDSGCGGAKLNRMDLPKSEHYRQILKAFPHWFCANLKKSIDRDAEVECDQHQWVALMAPRLLCVASASRDAWAGPQGEFETCRRASGAWEAQGCKGFVAQGFPKPDDAYQEGSVSYHLRAGGHDLTAFDWNRYMDFADRHGWRR